MKKRRKSEWIVGILAVLLLCSGCGSRDDAKESVSMVEEPTVQPDGQDTSEGAQSGEDLDVVSPDAADDTWYKSGSVYVDENGRRLEVFFDDEGMLQFAVDGLSLYNTMANDFQLENNWRIYTCDEGTTIIYYPGTPAKLEISDGEYAGVYEADDSM